MSDRLYHSLSRPLVKYALVAALVFVILVVSGREVANGNIKLMLAVISAGAFCVLAVAQRGACVGVLVLLAMNGIPFLDNSKSVAHHIAIQDIACLALIGTAFAWAIAGSRGAPTRAASILSWCGLALFGWCVLMVGRTWADGQAPFLGALRFGRDFMYFGALLAVLPLVRFRERDIEVLIAVLCAGVCLFAVGQIVTVEGLAHPTWLVHVGGTTKSLGVTRLFADMTDLVSAGVAFGVAAVTLTRGRDQSRAIPITLLLLTSLVLQLTRARWIAVITSVVLVSLWFALRADGRTGVILRRRLTIAAGVLAASAVLLLTVGGGLISAGPLVQRVLSIFTDVGSSTSTVAVRQHVANEMASLLGGRWLSGLGLTPPSVHYYPQFPGGSIRDPDVGVLNAVMTIGVIGAALIYLPLIVMLLHCMRRTRAGVRARLPWLNYGGQVWIIATVASSITLVTLFSPSGLILTAVILFVLSQPSVTGPDPPPPRPLQTDRPTDLSPPLVV
jgi:hypothetical protein